MEQVVGSAIKEAGRDNVLSGLRDVEDREGDRRLTGGNGQSARSAIQFRQPLLKHIRGRVHNPGIDVPELFEREQVRRVFG